MASNQENGHNISKLTALTHQSLVFEGVVDTPEEEPEGPEVLEPELEEVVGQQHQHPQEQQLHVDQGAEMK